MGWIKNVLCMFLQAMQLRFVQQADLEKSQNLQWLDVHRSEASASRSVAIRRQRRDERHLADFWKNEDKDKERREFDLEQAKLQEATASGDDRASGDEEQRLLEENVLPVAGDATTTGSSTQTSRSQDGSRTDSDSDEQQPSSPRGCLCVQCCLCFCCCRRRRHRKRRHGLLTWFLSRKRLPGGGYQYRCCNLDCTPSWFHAIMGFVLGWLIAKTDFTQIFNDSIVALGEQAGWQTTGLL